MAFVAFGLIGAFNTNAMEKKMAESGAALGYIKVNGTCQNASVTCDEVHNFLCKTPGNVQLYRNIGPNVCPEMLWRSVQ